MPSNDPRKKAKKVTSAKAWKKANAEMELELPSGNVCLVKRPGLPQLLSAKVLPDILTPIAEKAMTAGRGGVVPTDASINKEIEDISSQPGGMEEIMNSFGRVTAYVVVEPKVLYYQRQKEDDTWEEIPEDERDEDVLYTDYVDIQDQAFIFNFVVGGTTDLVEFRKQFGESVDGLALEPGTPEDPS